MIYENGSESSRFLCIFAVFFSGSQTAPDVTFLLVQIQQFSDLPIQGWVGLGQPFCQVLVHGGFGDPEALCSGTNCGTMLNHVNSQPTGSLLDGIIQSDPLPALLSDRKTYAVRRNNIPV